MKNEGKKQILAAMRKSIVERKRRKTSRENQGNSGQKKTNNAEALFAVCVVSKRIKINL